VHVRDRSDVQRTGVELQCCDESGVGHGLDSIPLLGAEPMRLAMRLLCGRLGQCGVRSPLSECEMEIYKNRPVFGFYPQLSYSLITMSAPTQATTPTASTTASMDWTRAKSEELRALMDDEDDVANAKRAEKRRHKQAKAEAEERARQEREEAARRAREETERRARAEAERKAKEEAEKKAREEFAKLQAERQRILEEKARLMAEDKCKAEVERRAEVAAGKQKAGELANKRAREEPVASPSGVQVIDLR